MPKPIVLYTKKRGQVAKAIMSDDVTDHLVLIDEAHHEVHESGNYLVSDVQNLSTTTMKWMVTTPDTLKWSHMVFDIECTGEVRVTILEGADRTGTNLLTTINRNRNNGIAAGTLIHRLVSAGTTDGATTIFDLRSGATGQGSKTITPGGGRGENEFMLKQNTKYVVSVTTFADVYATVHFDWYEHTNR